MQQKEIHAKRRLGQNFLRDAGVVSRIVGSLQLGPDDVLLEIGCGAGALSRQLVGKPRQYVGVELDTSLYERLMDLASPGVVFLNQDILSMDFSSLQKHYLRPGERLKVVGNLPYYISSPILQLLAQHARFIERAVIMLQAEVVERLVAQPSTKEYGFLTLLVQYYFSIRVLFTVSPRAFSPRPNVTSKVAQLIPHPKCLLNSGQESEFFQFVKRSFSQRRKTMKNALKGYAQWHPELLEALLGELGYPPDARAETLSLEDLTTLFQRGGAGNAS
jgi:16S rRNA (adenine1518-N6/adenine1519-N6)-dimethyltransferase